MLYIYSNSILSTEHKKKLTSLILTTTLKRKDKPNRSAMVDHATSAAQRWTGIHSPAVRLQCKVQYRLCRESSGCCLLLFIMLHIVILYLPNCKRTLKKTKPGSKWMLTLFQTIFICKFVCLSKPLMFVCNAFSVKQHICRTYNKCAWVKNYNLKISNVLNEWKWEYGQKNYST